MYGLYKGNQVIEVSTVLAGPAPLRSHILFIITISSVYHPWGRTALIHGSRYPLSQAGAAHPARRCAIGCHVSSALYFLDVNSRCFSSLT